MLTIKTLDTFVSIVDYELVFACCAGTLQSANGKIQTR